MTRLRYVAAAVLLVPALTSCAALSGVLDGGLPGGEGGDGYRVIVYFDDVLDLVEQAAVKVDDVEVGTVENIELEGYAARVTIRVRRDVDLPANATAELRQSSLLGEKFVELARPDSEPPAGRLGDGDVIAKARTSRNPEVEEVFTALAALLNGGGLPELQTISVELTRALSGRENEIRSVLRRLDRLVGALDARKGEIVRAVDALDRFAGSLARQRQVIAEAIDEITPALTVLADQRGELTALLRHLDRLGQVGARVVRASRDDTLADITMLRQVLAEVVKVKGELGLAVDSLTTLTQVLPRAIPSDYLQLVVELYLDPSTLPFAPAATDEAPTFSSWLLGGAR